MKRCLAACLLLAACASEDPPPANQVCERVKLVAPDAKCEPELTDVGERHAHRARITQKDGTVVCVLTDAMVTVECGLPFAAPAKDGQK